MSLWSRLFGAKLKSDYDKFSEAFEAVVGALCGRAFPNEPPLADLTHEQFVDRLRRATELLKPPPGRVSSLTREQLMDAATTAAIKLQKINGEPEAAVNLRIAQVIKEFNLTHLIVSAADPSPRVLDIRSAEYKEMELAASQGIDRPMEADALLALLEDAREWGRQNGHPAQSEFPQYEPIRAIGRALHDKGGRRAMQKAALHVGQDDSELLIDLNWFWNGVGDWMR